MWKKLHEQRGRTEPFPIYVDLSKVAVAHTLPSGMTRLRFSSGMENSVDVTEPIGDIIEEARPVVITDKDENDGGRGIKDGRPSNPAIKPDC